jgi:hypothetical protein
MIAVAAVRKLIHEAYAAGRRPRVHPNGFIQLDLTADGWMHLHVWPDPPINSAVLQKTRHTIHDHKFDMESTVLRGVLRNVTYEAVPFMAGSSGPAAYMLHRAYSNHVVGGTDTILKPDPGIYRLRELACEQVNEGATYRIPAYIFHDSIVFGCVVTLMTKTAVHPDYLPRIAVPLGVVPDNTFSRHTMSHEKLHEIILRSLYV